MIFHFKICQTHLSSEIHCLNITLFIYYFLLLFSNKKKKFKYTNKITKPCHDHFSGVKSEHHFLNKTHFYQLLLLILFDCFLEQVSWGNQAVSLSVPSEKQRINCDECVPASMLHFHRVGVEISGRVKRGDRYLFPYACSTGTRECTPT